MATASGRTLRLLGLTHAGTSRENMNQEVELCLFLVFSATVYEDSEITSQRLGKYIALCLFLTYQPPSSCLLIEVWQSHRTALPRAAFSWVLARLSGC